MIIKMNVGDGWRFVDGVDDVEYFGYDSRESKVSSDQFTIFYETTRQDIPTLPSFVLVRAKRPNGETVGIVSGYELYLLNDNGKTIERLN